MKHLKIYCLVIILAAFGIGCASILPGSDPLVVRAEQGLKAADATFNTYVQVEYANRDLLKKVDIKFETVADKIRVGWTNWVVVLDKALLSYKHAKTPENQAALAQAQATVDTNLAAAQALLSQAITNINPNIPKLNPIGN